MELEGCQVQYINNDHESKEVEIYPRVQLPTEVNDHNTRIKVFPDPRLQEGIASHRATSLPPTFTDFWVHWMATRRVQGVY